MEEFALTATILNNCGHDLRGMTTFPLVRPKMAIEILVSNFAEKRLK
jgi:outer membrane lipopolysaccharide assembly protein LptE/RlpB